jgi:LPXTG-site transpeptidase (sortase) family protein
MEVHSWPQFIDAVLKRKVSFLVAFFVIFLSTYAVLAWLDFLPELVEKPEVIEKELMVSEPMVVEKVVIEEEIVTPQEEVVLAPIFPTLITIEALNRSVTILNPSSREVADLDEALLSGVVRHPDSATLEQSGTVFILGHSSYLPVVRNKAFQAFNGIQDLKWGDIITLTAEEGEYVYRVDKVYRAKASEVTVPIAGPDKKLFLATCNSFGSTDDRYIVEADLIEVR